jgi:hypothetical protein
MKLRDTTDYRFAAGSRRLLVRPGDASGDPEVAARTLADGLGDFLKAANVVVGPTTTTAGGAAAVVVTADLPPDPDAGGNPRAQHTAVLAFPGHPLTEITLQADRADAGAAAEFKRLVESARPAPAGPAVEAVARAVAAGPTGHPAHPAGGLLLDLTADYSGTDRFEVATEDKATRFALERAAAGGGLERAAVTAGPRLVTGSVAAATLEGGRSVRYELPARAPGRAGLEAAPGPERGATPAAGGGPGAIGAVGGVPVKITVTGPVGPADQKLADDLLKALQAAPK